MRPFGFHMMISVTLLFSTVTGNRLNYHNVYCFTLFFLQYLQQHMHYEHTREKHSWEERVTICITNISIIFKYVYSQWKKLSISFVPYSKAFENGTQNAYLLQKVNVNFVFKWKLLYISNKIKFFRFANIFLHLTP